MTGKILLKLAKLSVPTKLPGDKYLLGLRMDTKGAYIAFLGAKSLDTLDREFIAQNFIMDLPSKDDLSILEPTERDQLHSKQSIRYFAYARLIQKMYY